MGKIISLSIGMPKNVIWKGKNEESAINKKRVQSAFLRKQGFIDDDVANHKYHGGADRAVCVYPFEHYAKWENEFKQSFEPPSVGENLCVTEMLEKDVYIGDTYSIGETIVQITQGRIPCDKISKHNGVDSLLSRMVETGYTGYFFRVVQEGLIEESSQVKLIERTQEKVSVLYANQIMFHDRKNKKAIEEILAVKELAEKWLESLEKAYYK
ncbi:MOSC domain-containing protein [Bacillus massilinigeriensis]|uniref:MOSC domain-containing protein n=1 Tax=Bacillus massilionigeriensis TaxID=1805475 RepID=UPI00096B49A1|nr:MOSC domain-containing protein [Bacillus massilionigeriensis]